MAELVLAMKGIIFRELCDMVEEAHGVGLLDEVVEASHLPTSEGAYTTVGTYPFEEMQSLVTVLSKKTATPLPALLYAFGRHLLSRFLERFPHFFDGVEGTFSLLERVDDHIHVEVHKLYPDAELPRFIADRTGDSMTLEYRSPRAMSDVALGLIEASAEHFGEDLTVARELLEADGTRVLFRLAVVPGS